MGVTVGNIEIVGLGELIKSIDLADEQLVRRIDMEMQASCLQIERDAKRMAPYNVGRLSQLIKATKKGVLNYEIVSAANYSSYMEFGTKSYVMVPAGWDEFAVQYEGVSIDSGGVTLKQAIYEWARQKGIDEKWWYWIYKKIMLMGVKPHPFFIPALVELGKLEIRIANILGKPIL